MRKITAILMLALAVAFTFCSSDNTPIVEDFTNADYIKELMIGTWDMIEAKGSDDKWVEMEKGMVYKFNSQNDYTFKWVVNNEEITDSQYGTYIITPATSIYNATINLY